MIEITLKKYKISGEGHLWCRGKTSEKGSLAAYCQRYPNKLIFKMSCHINFINHHKWISFQMKHIIYHWKFFNEIISNTGYKLHFKLNLLLVMAKISSNNMDTFKHGWKPIININKWRKSKLFLKQKMLPILDMTFGAILYWKLANLLSSILYHHKTYLDLSIVSMILNLWLYQDTRPAITHKYGLS